MLPAGVTIYIRPGRTDMRKQIDGLAAIVQEGMGKKPFTGDLFLFCGRDRRIIKALYWERNGFCLWIKRLERGTFPWPSLSQQHEGGEEGSRELKREELEMILDGIDFRKRFTELVFSTVA